MAFQNIHKTIHTPVAPGSADAAFDDGGQHLGKLCSTTGVGAGGGGGGRGAGSLESSMPGGLVISASFLDSLRDT